MTREEKIDQAFSLCRSYKGCNGCPNGDEAAARCIPCEFNKMPDFELEAFLKRFEAAKLVKMSNADFAVEVAERIAQRELNAEKDNVNHPQHYELPGGIECIDVLLATQGKEAVQAFCLCNAIKYLYRHKRKNGVEDIKKARWYIEKYLELEGESNAQARE